MTSPFDGNIRRTDHVENLVDAVAEKAAMFPSTFVIKRTDTGSFPGVHADVPMEIEVCISVRMPKGRNTQDPFGILTGSIANEIKVVADAAINGTKAAIVRPHQQFKEYFHNA